MSGGPDSGPAGGDGGWRRGSDGLADGGDSGGRLAILAGLAGVVVPGLPALPLCWGGVLVWAVFGGAGPGRWAVFAAATVVAAGGTVIKYAWPGRNLKRTGVPTSSLLAGGCSAGRVLRGPGGRPGARLRRRGVGGGTAAAGQHQLAWPSTVQA